MLESPQTTATPHRSTGNGKAKSEEPRDRLHTMARAAVVQAKGNADAAAERLGTMLVKEDDAALERELAKNWRPLALKAAIASAFQSLRAEGKYRQPTARELEREAAHVSTTDYGRMVTPPRSTAPALSEKAGVARHCMLDAIVIYGVRLRDAKVGVARRWADDTEDRVRFVRAIIPDYADDNTTVGTYVDDPAADEAWAKIQAAAV